MFGVPVDPGGPLTPVEGAAPALFCPHSRVQRLSRSDAAAASPLSNRSADLPGTAPALLRARSLSRLCVTPAFQVLLFMDARTQRESAAIHRPTTAGGTDSTKSVKPYSQLRKAVARQPGDGYSYPTNATGLYRGSWTLGVAPSPLSTPNSLF